MFTRLCHKPVVSTIGSICSMSLLLALATSAVAADPAANCAAAKQKAAAKKLSDKVKCHGKAIKKAVDVDPLCLTKAETKFDASFTKAEGKGGCATTGDAAAIEALVDDTLDALLTALPESTTSTTLPPGCVDADGDGYAGLLTGTCTTGTDCDDGDASINPGAAEVCGDSLDNNCDGTIDEGCTPQTCNFIQQDCPSGQACYATTASCSGGFTGECSAAGSGGQGATCTSPTDCAAGFACVLTSSGSQCRAYCSTSTPCTNGLICIALTGCTGVSVCL